MSRDCEKWFICKIGVNHLRDATLLPGESGWFVSPPYLVGPYMPGSYDTHAECVAHMDEQIRTADQRRIGIG